MSQNNYHHEEIARPNGVIEESSNDTSESQIIHRNRNEILPTDTPPTETQNIKTAFAGVAGNILEWYDFATFGFFSDIISENFFPPDQQGNNALIQTFIVFGVAFLVRPIGGAIFGLMGDTHGRKGAVENSSFLMAFPTFFLGCLPTYSMVGWLSTLLLVIMRLLQGLSVGGQIMSSLVFTLERTHISRWGFWGSTVYAASSIGVTAGSIFSAALRESLTDEQLHDWGWRIPFLFGALGAVPAAYLKLHATEHAVIPANKNAKSAKQDIKKSGGEQKPNSLKGTFSAENRRALIASCLLPSVPATTYYLTFIWLATYMETIADPPIPHAMTINSALGIVGGIFLTLLGGWIADIVGDYSKQMFMSAIALAILQPLLMAFIGTGWDGSDASITITAFVIQLILAFLLSCWNGAMLPWMILKFPAELRLTSASIGYNIALSIWGGFSPAVATVLVSHYHHFAPGLLVTVAAIVSLQSLWIAPRGFESVSSKAAMQNPDTSNNKKGNDSSHDESQPIWAIDDDDGDEDKEDGIEML